ncbi:MAG: hypothetical protein LIP01_04045 [Tannerellaceae bacterium]|nr:hypothetical protein [Tannerellaceae bacterium]
MMKDEWAKGYKAPTPEKETGRKDELPDPYLDDRAAQPEYVGGDPLRFEDPAIIVEDTPLYANDIEDDRTDKTVDE